jgi:hypothetical protein
LLLQGAIPVDYSANNGEARLFVICDIIMSMGNTVGSRAVTPLEVDWAYIAGFFDGDGSLMVQIKNRRDTPRGWRIMFTLCFYQDSRHKEPLQWMQSIVGIGYIHDRNDGMTEFRINGYNQVKRVLTCIQPHIKFKKKQVDRALKMLEILDGNSFLSLSEQVRSQLADWFNEIRQANYSFSRGNRFTAEEIKLLLTR